MKLELLDEVTLKSGIKGKIVEFDIKSPTGYTVCLGITTKDGEYVRH